MDKITHEISSLPNQIVSLKRLEAELQFIGMKPEGCSVVGGNIEIYYEQDFLTEGRRANILALLSQHTGQAVPNIDILASQTLMGRVFEVSNTDEWQVIGSQLLRPGKVHPDVPSLITQMVGEVSVTGSSGEIRMVEIRPTGESTILTNPHSIFSINAGAWEAIDIFSNTPLTDTFNRYEVQARKAGQGSFMLRNVTTSLIRLT